MRYLRSVAFACKRGGLQCCRAGVQRKGMRHRNGLTEAAGIEPSSALASESGVLHELSRRVGASPLGRATETTVSANSSTALDLTR